MESFGKFLIRKGLLTDAQLEEATQGLVVVGGRLGTNAVELGYLEIEELDRCLSEYRGLSNPPDDWLAAPSDEALAAVPDALARKHMILPLAIQKRCLHLAMADPHDPNCVDEVAFASGLGIQAYILSEAHLGFLRERHMGIQREGRFRHLAPLSAGRGRRRKKRKVKLTMVAPEAAAQAAETLRQRQEAFVAEPLELRDELADPETFTSLHEAWRGADGKTKTEAKTDRKPAEEPDAVASQAPAGLEAAQPLAPPDVARLELLLQTAAERDQIVELTLRLARTYASVAALFVVHRGTIRGSAAVGEGITDRIDGVFLSVESESVFSAPASGAAAFRGEPPQDGIDRQLFDALGRSKAEEAAILPVRIGQHVLNLLYVDNGSAPLGESSFAALEALCTEVARAYERLVLARKRSHC